MLKRLAIFGVLLGCVSGAWPQVPGNGSSQHNKAQEKQETANPPKPVVVVDSHHGANNQEQAAEKPAKYPWGELLAPANIPNWFLVVVGGITGWFVYKTLRAIKRQADLMERQDRTAREKQRAHLDLIPPTETPSSIDMVWTDQHGKKLDSVEVSIAIILDGESNAYNVQVSGGLSITESKDAKFIPNWARLECPTVIREATPKDPIPISLAPGGFGAFTGIYQSEMDKVRTGNAFLHAAGQILYEDVFGDSHATPFHFVYYVVRQGSWPDEDGWENLSGKAT